MCVLDVGIICMFCVLLYMWDYLCRIIYMLLYVLGLGDDDQR